LKDTVPVVLSAVDDPPDGLSTYNPSADSKYLGHQYHMRSWWDEGYKLPPCEADQKPSFSCSNPNLGSGVGPALWLSYGDNPPKDARFNLGLTIQRVWNWWWNRQPFGAATGAYDMDLFIQKTMNVTP